MLVVDDDSFITELIETMLQKMGINHVQLANDGSAAVASMEGRPSPDVVICDLSMPEKDGFAVMADFASLGYKGGLILMSGHHTTVLDTAVQASREHRLNLIGVLQKPVQRVALGAALAQAIAMKATA